MTFRCQALLFGLTALAVAAPSTLSAAELVWPADAAPVVRWQSAVRSLDGFELAVQGPVAETADSVRKLKRPSGLAFDSRGRLLISDSRLGLLLRIDPDLGVAMILGSGTDPRLAQPMGVAARPDGRIYVADAGLQSVIGFDAEGAIERVYGAGALEEPVDVAVTPDGARLYVADAQADRIVIFDVESAESLDTFGTRGKGAGEFYLPTAVEFDADGRLMVVDQLNSRVQIFDPDGTFSRALYPDRATGFSRPSDVAVDGAGRLYLTDSAQSRVQVFDADLEPLFALGRNGLGDGEFLGVGAIAVTGERLAVLDRAGGRVQMFDLLGAAPRPTAVRVGARREAASTPAVSATRPASPRQAPTPPSPSEAAQAESQPTPPAEPAVEQEPAVEEPMTAPLETVASVDPTELLFRRVTDWATAWTEQDVERYLSFYADAFEPPNGLSRAAWEAQRRERLTAPSSIVVELEVVETRLGDGEAEVVIDQSYTSDRYADRVRKELRLISTGDDWKIARETVLEALE